MPIFSDTEIAEYRAIMESAATKAEKTGKPPQISEILLSLQFGVTLPINDNGDLWFMDEQTRTLVTSSIKKLMTGHNPDEFSVIEKAFMFSVLQAAFLFEQGGFNITDDEEGKGFTESFNDEMTDGVD